MHHELDEAEQGARPQHANFLRCEIEWMHHFLHWVQKTSGR
jgi:hypothetical protein